MPDALVFDHFLSHDELSSLLHEWGRQHPDLLEVESIGASHEGRDIWLATITRSSTGPASEKPALFVEGGIHAVELTGSCAALHLIHQLLDTYGRDPRTTRLVDTRTVYVLPQVNPDGAEAVLREGRFLRSSTRPHPSRTPAVGLHAGDIDGDGRMLFMRVEDPDGPWKISEVEPRLLAPRRPDEAGGRYFRLLQEGHVVGYDGVRVDPAPPLEGLDLGRNLPTGWEEPVTDPSAGDFPGSEAETRAILRALVERPNVAVHISCHTFGGLLLHPPVNEQDVVPAFDRMVYEMLGHDGSRRTGYELMAVHELKYAPMRIRGSPLDWYYRQRGLLAWTTEFWNPAKAAGVRPAHPSRWLIDHDIEDARTLLRWSDTELAGRGFVDWYPYDHPQLGKVELGGWDIINYWYNPPIGRVSQEVAPHSDWVIFQGLSTARLVVRSFTTEQVAKGVHRIELVLANEGWLPTYVTKQALHRGVADGIRVALDLPPEVGLVAGGWTVDLGQLEGRVEDLTATTWWGHRPGTPNRTSYRWMVTGSADHEVTATVRHPQAGTVHATVRL